MKPTLMEQLIIIKQTKLDTLDSFTSTNIAAKTNFHVPQLMNSNKLVVGAIISATSTMSLFLVIY